MLQCATLRRSRGAKARAPRFSVIPFVCFVCFVSFVADFVLFGVRAAAGEPMLNHPYS